MSLSNPSEVEQRSVEKFYTRIRLHLDDIEHKPQDTKKPVADRLRHLSEEHKYGMITAKELEMILANYDDSSDKPTRTEQLLAGSFAKLLYSKTGFHHPGSTEYLVEDLNIKDRERDSFLDGHSTYSVSDESSLKGILEHHKKMYIKTRAGELLDLMNDQSVNFQTLETDVNDLVGKEPKSGNCLVVSGKYHLQMKRHNQAAQELKRALETECDYVDQLRMNLSEACFRIGMDLYNRRVLDQAKLSFVESLMYNHQHQSSSLHLQMCNRQLEERSRRFGEQPNAFNMRRR